MNPPPPSLSDLLSQLLEVNQREELPALHLRFPDPRLLCKELIERGWLTPFQANQLLTGRGPELILGSYVLLEKLGEGGMGTVFKARHRILGRVAAIKLVRKDRLSNPHAVKRFQREVRSAAALSHPNIVLAYDADEIDGTHLMVMEYIDRATDLAKLVKKSGPLPVAAACEFIRQAALGLQHAYERGMVHRDIKPANLLLAADGKTIKVLDMGLALFAHISEGEEKTSTMTEQGAVMGPPDFMAPEQADDSHNVDIRADIYSLGCSLYFLLTARVPFPACSLVEKLIRHRMSEPVPVEKLRPEVPPALADITRTMLAKNPEDRYQTPAEVVEALASVRLSSYLPPTNADHTEVEQTEVLPQQTAAKDSFEAALKLVAQRAEVGAMAPERCAPKPCGDAESSWASWLAPRLSSALWSCCFGS